MSYFAAKMHQIRFRLGLQTPLGELTAFPQTPSWFYGALLLREGEDREGREGRGWGGVGEGEGGQGREGTLLLGYTPEIES